MKNLLTGAAQSVTDTNERARKLFENRPLEAPAQRERTNFNSRQKKPQAAAGEEEAEVEDEAPEAHAAEDDAPETEVPEVDKPVLTEDDAEEE